MTRKLKTFTTSIGFYDLAIAAPSMKAALDAWGTQQNLFHQGLAEETDDPDAVAATLARPGAVLRRAVGTRSPFQENAAPPKSLAGNAPRRDARPKPVKKSSKAVADPRAQKAAVIQFEAEKARRDREREKQRTAREKGDAEQARQDERRQKAADRAQAVLDRARARHEGRMAQLERDLQAAEAQRNAERDRWRRELDRLENDVRKAR